MNAEALSDLLQPIQFVTPDREETARLLELELRRRLRLIEAIGDDEDMQRMMLAMCARDTCFFFDNFLWSYDPRAADDGSPAYLPFVLWPRQREAVLFQEDAIKSRQETLWEKSRDTGASYICAGLALKFWRFSPGFKTTFCSNKLENVDTLGDPDSVFEKIRIMLERLPRWMFPKGFSWTSDSLQARLINPENKNIINGEGGKEAGRSGRSTWYVIDEAAYVDEAERVNRATSANTNARTWVSSPDPGDNFFSRHRRNPRVKIFSYRWYDHPGRDEAWAAAKRELIGEKEFKAEYEIDYDAVTGGAVIERAWADACVELYRRHGETFDASLHAPRVALDVGAGKSESTLAIRRGPLVMPVLALRTPDTTSTAEWAAEACREAGGRSLVFDAVGVGYGVASTLRRLTGEEDEAGREFVALPFVGGASPSGEEIWEDGRSSKERFVNQRAQVWWSMREAARRSYERIQAEEGKEGGIPHALEECLMIPPGDEILLRQMCSVPWRPVSERRIQLKAKRDLKDEGIASPDRADALAMTFFEPPFLDVDNIEVMGTSLSVGGSSLQRMDDEDMAPEGDTASEFARLPMASGAGRWW